MPESFFDFKAKAGYSTYAALDNYYDSIQKAIFYERSINFHRYSKEIFKSYGDNCIFRKVTYPSTSQVYDLVLSSHNLLSVKSYKALSKQVEILWQITGKYLVILNLFFSN